MSATLTWASSGLGTKTGTAIADCFNDLDTLITSKSGDATFFWQVAAKNVAATPYWLNLKRKDGSAGRILLICYTSAPAGTPTVMFDVTPTNSSIYGAYFPAGNVDTPSNLTSAGGTVMGSDTGAVKVWAQLVLSSMYTTSYQPFYFDSSEGMVFGFQNPAAATCYWGAAGAIVVDASDNAYSAVMSAGSNSASTFGATSPTFPFSASTINAGAVTACVRTNYGSSNRVYFQAWAPSGTWASVAVSSTDILTDTGASKAWFAPVPLLGQTKGEGFVLKLRQMSFGPGTTGPFTPYNTTGPVVQSRQFNGATTGGNGYPWLTNFKL